MKVQKFSGFTQEKKKKNMWKWNAFGNQWLMKEKPIETVILISMKESNRLIQTRVSLISQIFLMSRQSVLIPLLISAWSSPTGRHTKYIYIYSVCMWWEYDSGEDGVMGSMSLCFSTLSTGVNLKSSRLLKCHFRDLCTKSKQWQNKWETWLF